MSLEIPGSFSQAHQESFVVNVLNHKTNGYYVELGAGWGIYNSNTFLLESKYSWQGLSIDVDPYRIASFNTVRKNKCIFVDGRRFDYRQYFVENNFPKQIDYLQLDIHPASDTLLALKQLPLDEYRFSVITYEHNGYIDEYHKEIQLESQRILNSYGYDLVVKDLILDEMWIAYEDWWVDPECLPESSYGHFRASAVSDVELFRVFE
jgi:hypothetical protein